MTEERVVDQRGRRCPLPVIELARRISEVPVGEVIRLITDDPAAATDVPAWCSMRGHTLVDTLSEGGASVYRVRRSG